MKMKKKLNNQKNLKNVKLIFKRIILVKFKKNIEIKNCRSWKFKIKQIKLKNIYLLPKAL